MEGIKMAAKKTGGTGNRLKNANSARAAFMAAHGIKRMTFRDPITNVIRPIGSYPGMNGKIQG